MNEGWSLTQIRLCLAKLTRYEWNCDERKRSKDSKVLLRIALGKLLIKEEVTVADAKRREALCFLRFRLEQVWVSSRPEAVSSRPWTRTEADFAIVGSREHSSKQAIAIVHERTSEAEKNRQDKKIFPTNGSDWRVKDCLDGVQSIQKVRCASSIMSEQCFWNFGCSKYQLWEK